MSDHPPADYYELLQLSPNADVDTINRVYRLLAQRLHPDNQETGNEERFRALTEAHNVLNDPERRARYDITYHAQKQDRWRIISADPRPGNDFEMERLIRMAVLEVLYTRRRIELKEPGLYIMELAELLGKPREHLEFTLWYLTQKGFVQRTDNSKLAITIAGADHVEQHSQGNNQRRQLGAFTSST
jgi:curved DNA-binding protein CbpA